jgi:hypothetical protein
MASNTECLQGTTGITVLNSTSLINFAISGTAFAQLTNTSIQLGLPLQGMATNTPLQYLPASVALTSGSNVAVASTCNYLNLTGTLTGTGTTVTLPAKDGGFWILNTSGVTFSAHTIGVIINGNTWGTTLGASGVWRIFYSTGQGKPFGEALSA